jgi:hypothetical protein
MTNALPRPAPVPTWAPTSSANGVFIFPSSCAISDEKSISPWSPN